MGRQVRQWQADTNWYKVLLIVRPWIRSANTRLSGNWARGALALYIKRQTRAWGELWAIKVLKAQDDAGMVRRFQAEARTAANLRHRNIVTVFEFGEEKGMQFLVMEYLDGTTLRDLIVEKTPISAVEKLNIMSEAALGLKAAHDSGILHRDVKPANIMRLSDGSVKIMDFGISRPLGDMDTRLTQAGFLMGTPQYMAPEQFTGDADADVLCDIWAYGVVLYEFLTASKSVHMRRSRHRSFDRRPAEELVPAFRLHAGRPERLEAVVKRLLAKNRVPARSEHRGNARFDLEPVLPGDAAGRVRLADRDGRGAIWDGRPRRGARRGPAPHTGARPGERVGAEMVH